jgi:hypothetical protein
VPVLTRKPGALRNRIERVRRKLRVPDDGTGRWSKILTAVLTHGLQAAEAACVEAIGAGLASADVILNVLARQQPQAASVPT